MSRLITAADLAPELRAPFRRFIISLADTKRLLGLRYSDWLLGAPSIETGIAAASMAQDEWGHARLIYAMLKEFGDDPSKVEHDRPAEEYASNPMLDRPFSDWAGFVAAMVVVDGAATLVLEGFSDGGFDQARSRIPKMLGEEEFHRDMARAWLRKLLKGTDAARERVLEALTAAVPATLAWMAPEDTAHEALVEAGLTAPAAALLARFREQYGDILRAAGLDALEPDYTGWDEARGRGPGAPAEEIVERARGDRNRALLVE